MEKRAFIREQFIVLPISTSQGLLVCDQLAHCGYRLNTLSIRERNWN